MRKHQTDHAIEIPDRLGIDPEHITVVGRENWYYADGEPMQIGVTFSPWFVVEGTPIADSAKIDKESLYARFEERGYAITTILEKIGARMPTPEEAVGLSMLDGVPMIIVVRTSYGQDDRPFEVTEFVMRASHGALDYRLTVES